MSETAPHANSRAPAPTMSDVARLASVSLQTVSRVLNGHPFVTAAALMRRETAEPEPPIDPQLIVRATTAAPR
jgi:Bacterial regulatory proteins, lacI family